MVASVGMPPSISRAGAGACTTPSSQRRQAYFGRRVTSTRELRRHDVQPLALVLADPVQLTLAAGAGLAVDIDDDLDPWQMRRQRAAIGASLLGPRGSFGRSRLICYRRIARRRLLDVFEAEQHLIFRQRLGPAPKTVPLQLLDDLAQPLTLALLGEQHRFQRLEIVG